MPNVDQQLHLTREKHAALLSRLEAFCVTLRPVKAVICNIRPCPRLARWPKSACGDVTNAMEDSGLFDTGSPLSNSARNDAYKNIELIPSARFLA
jgi:hypothetical protein